MPFRTPHSSEHAYSFSSRVNKSYWFHAGKLKTIHQQFELNAWLKIEHEIFFWFRSFRVGSASEERHSAFTQQSGNFLMPWFSTVHSWGHASVPLNSERIYCTFSWLFLQIEWIHNKDYLITGFGKGGCTAPLDPWNIHPRWKGKPCTSSRNICSVADSVGDLDPEPDPQDPHVFGPPGSGSGSISPFSHKCVERTEIMTAK